MELHEFSFSGSVLKRGFWLYVWEVVPPKGRPLFYVGRTGDSSATKAQSPFNRMGQHLGFAKNSNMLRKYLGLNFVIPEECQFRMVALGPIHRESTSKSRTQHDERRDSVAAMEKALAEVIAQAGYRVMNPVSSRKRLDSVHFAEVKAAFAGAFPELSRT